MKKFFGKFLLLFLPLVLLTGILNFFYTRTNYWKYSDNRKFDNVPKTIQLANIGSSLGRDSFDYDIVPNTSFNFALGSQRFLYDYAVLKQYIDHFEKNAVLFIPTGSYIHLTSVKTDFRDQRSRYYHFLDKEYMDFYSIGEKILYTIAPVLTAGYTLRFIVNDQEPPTQTIRVTAEFEITRDSITKLRALAGNMADIKTKEEGFAWNKYWAGQIIELCYANDIQPVLVSTPVISILNNMITEEIPGFFDDFYRFIRELQEAYPSLPYFDCSHDPRFVNDFSLFANAHHLNKAGAEKFTAIVLSDLKANGIVIPGP